MYNANINCTFSLADNNEMELELLFKDSDGKDIGAYAAGNDLTAILTDVADQIEEAIAAAEKEEEEMNEIDRLNKKIEELTKQLEDLNTRNAYLEKKTKVDISNNKNNDEDDYSYLLDKVNNFKSVWGDDFAPLFKHIIA